MIVNNKQKWKINGRVYTNKHDTKHLIQYIKIVNVLSL